LINYVRIEELKNKNWKE